MLSLITAAGGIGTVLALVVWALKAYTAAKNAKATAAERQAGRDAQQNEATNAEINRVNAAANAGAGRLPIDTPDPYNLDK